MNIKSFLDEVCEQIKYKPAKKEISSELELHIKELKEDYINDGMEELEAEEKAVLQMGIAKDIGKSLNKIHRPKLNWQLLLAIIFLICFGILISIFKQQISHSGYIGNTIIYILFGFITSIVIYLCDYKKIKKYSNIIYLIATLIMLLPFVGLGLNLDGKNFVRFFGITFSPCIIAIPLYVIAFSGYIYNYNENNKIKTNLFKIIILSVFSLLLVSLLPSLVNVIILSIIYLIITTAKIIELNQNIIKKLVLLYGFALIFLSVLIFRLNVTNSMNLKHIDEQISSIQKDILENVQFIGEAESQTFKDEELLISNESNYTFLYLLGKVGIFFSVVLIATVILTSLLLIYNVKRINEKYGKYLIIGLSTLFILESLGNILMNINTNVTVDINLPFVTYGSVYFLINCFIISIILSIYRKKDINVYDQLYKNSDTNKLSKNI